MMGTWIKNGATEMNPQDTIPTEVGVNPDEMNPDGMNPDGMSLHCI